jgi:hypothetical protein
MMYFAAHLPHDMFSVQHALCQGCLRTKALWPAPMNACMTDIKCNLPLCTLSGSNQHRAVGITQTCPANQS